jgi:hypothetical protein
MNAIAIPSEELKPKTWYYGIRCVCARVLALAEDTFAGRGEDQHVSAVPMSVQCECGALTHAKVLHKFRTP